MRQIVDLVLKEAVFDGTCRNSAVVQWTDPESLMIALTGSSDGRLPRHPQDDGQLVDLIARVIRYSVKTGHPRFVNQLFSR